MNDKIRDFAIVAEQYCQWAESLDPSDEINLNDLLLLLSELLNKVLLMPDVDPSDSDEEKNRISHDEWMKIHKWFTPIKFQYYREIFDPHDFKEDEPITGDLHDDLADIYRELKPALLLYIDDKIEDAAFEWKSTFGYHWGEHLISAMRAIYMFER